MVKAKKHLGQHFLADNNIAEKIASSLINENDCSVLEIGPGTGVLTKQLIKRFDKLTLIEIDSESVDYLKTEFIDEFTLIEGDFLKMSLNEHFSEDYCIIGNFPYNISSQIFFKLLENKQHVPELVCMIQKEVAQRIASVHGNKVYGILSVFLQLYYKIDYLFTVSEKVFIPPPKVKSAVIRLTRYRDKIEGVDEKKLFMLVKMAFNQRRKTLRNSLKAIIGSKVDTTNPIFGQRPEQLSPEDFVELTKLLFAV